VRHPKSWRQPTGVIKSDCALKGKSISFSKRHLSCASSREYNKFCIITLRTMKDKAELTRVGCLSPELAEGHPACRNDTCKISESSKAYIQNYPNVQNLAPSPVLALYETVGCMNTVDIPVPSTSHGSKYITPLPIHRLQSIFLCPLVEHLANPLSGEQCPALKTNDETADACAVENSRCSRNIDTVNQKGVVLEVDKTDDVITARKVVDTSS